MNRPQPSTSSAVSSLFPCLFSVRCLGSTLRSRIGISYFPFTFGTAVQSQFVDISLHIDRAAFTTQRVY